MIAAYIILYISNLSPLFALWTGRSNKGVIWYYALACIVFDISAFILKAFHIERLWLSNTFFLAEFLLLSGYFYQAVFPERYRKQVLAVLCLLALYFVIDTCIHSVLKPNYAGAALFYSLYILFAIVGLYKVMKGIEYLMIERSPLFIFCIAFLIYAAGSFIILLFEHELRETNTEFMKLMWCYVRNPMNILKNILIGYGLMLMNKHKPHSVS